MTFDVMDIRVKLGQNIKRIRKERGLSQEDCAFESGLHRTYVSDIERGNRNPTVTVIGKIALALKVEPKDLLDWDYEITE